MTCKHVLDLIDAGTFTDQSREQLDAVRQHARQCLTCEPALDAATAITADLVALPQPAPPPDLAAAVLARIERIDIDAEATSHTADARSTTHNRPMWASLAGVAAGVALILSTPLAESATTAIALPAVRGLTGNLVAMPSTAAGVLALAAGLAFYAAGLFAPVSERLTSRT